MDQNKPDDGRSISRNVAEKHYDSRHDKLRKQYEYNGINKHKHIQEHQSWLGERLPDFVFVYLHFKVPPIRITDLVRNAGDENSLLM